MQADEGGSSRAPAAKCLAWWCLLGLCASAVTLKSPLCHNEFVRWWSYRVTSRVWLITGQSKPCVPCAGLGTHPSFCLASQSSTTSCMCLAISSGSGLHQGMHAEQAPL